MTTEQIITLAKEKLGKDITEQEAQDYLSGKISLPDEALDLVSGGGGCSSKPTPRCPVPECGGESRKKELMTFVCLSCGKIFTWDDL